MQLGVFFPSMLVASTHILGICELQTCMLHLPLACFCLPDDTVYDDQLPDCKSQPELVPADRR